jgi:hypothetical protein
MSGTNAVETQFNDCLMYLAPLPHVARFYPYGFPVDVATNAREVLDSARESWGAYSLRFDKPPIRLHVLVSEGSGDHLPPAPVLRGQRHLLAWMADQENFSVCDRAQRFSYCCVTRATVADHVFFRWHFLEALVYLLLEQNYYTSLHAACIALDGAGVLLYGVSGVGKSTLSYACARRGWTYVSDDSSSVLWDSDLTVIGESHHFRFRAEAPDLFPELRALTVGRQLDRKPTIEVYTADLPIHTALDCRVERIVFVDRRPGPVTLKRIGKEATQERIRHDMPAFDPEIDAQRCQVISSISELPAFEMGYSNYEEAVPVLERLVRNGASA